MLRDDRVANFVKRLLREKVRRAADEQNARDGSLRDLRDDGGELLYDKSPFSCSSWQSMQNGVQGTACSRFSPITFWQLVQVP